jgi:hypothetical protein
VPIAVRVVREHPHHFTLALDLKAIFTPGKCASQDVVAFTSALGGTQGVLLRDDGIAAHDYDGKK